jgi:hypothetical protein
LKNRPRHYPGQHSCIVFGNPNNKIHCSYGLFTSETYCSNGNVAPSGNGCDETELEEAMKKALIMLMVGASLASCTATEQGAGIGAASGAIIGGVATGNVRGAAVGAAVGGVAGALIGNVSEQPGQCYYRDRYGRRYIDDCPRRS